MIVRLGGELVEFSEVELVEQFVLAGKPDEIVKALRIIQSFNDFAHFSAINDLRDLLRKNLGVGGVKMEKSILDRLNIGENFGLGFEQIGVTLQFITEFALEFVEVILVGLFKLRFDIDEINHVTIPIAFVGAVHSGKRLK